MTNTFFSIRRNLLLSFLWASAAATPALAQLAEPPRTPQAASEASKTAPNPEARITAAIDERKLVRVPGNVHPKARAEFDRGVVSDGQPITRMLLLLQRGADQDAALRQLLDDQQTRGSASHHAWLTPEQFGRQFGPADADIQTATAWLAGHGFHSVKVGPGRTAIEFSGTAGQVREAFHTEIHHYVVKGEEYFANSSDPQLPAALTPVMAGVVSLHNFPKYAHTHPLGMVQRNNQTGVLSPLFSFSGCSAGGATQCNGIGPADFAKIYNIPSNLDGAGQSIAVVGQTNINIQDAKDYRSIFGLALNDPLIIVNGPDPGLTADESEADLDIELSGGVAPKASIKFVASQGVITGATSGIDLSALYIIENNIAAVMAESYGLCESSLGTTGNKFYNALWQQAAAQGITVLISTGDNGSASCDDPNTVDFASKGLAVNGLASTPYNVAVGGTDFSYSGTNPSSLYWNVTNTGATGSSAKSYIPESTWNDSCAAFGASGCTAAVINADVGINSDLVAGSGGHSTIYSKPAWQSGITGMPADGKRDIPDVSVFASNGANGSFYIVCQKDFTGTASCDLNAPFSNFEAVGGTSASVQAFAGIMALINQSQATPTNPAPRQGNANYILYQLYKSNPSGVCVSNAAAVAASGCIFYDVTKGNIAVACKGGTPNCSNTSTVADQYGATVNAAAIAWPTTPGYDLATGLGSVNVADLANKWSSAALTGTTTAITASPSATLAHGSNANFTVHVAPAGGASGTPTGQVALIATPLGAAQSGIGPFTLSSGTATITTDMLPGGTAYSVVAHYSGDGTFAQSDSAAVIVTVSKESSKTVAALITFDPSTGAISSNNATTAPYGSPYIMRINVTNAAGVPCSNNLNAGTIPPIDTIPCPTGSVSVTDNGAPLNDFPNTGTGVSSGTVTLNAQGYFEDQPIQLPAGTHSIVAAYAGDTSYTASSSAADGITITKAATAVSAASQQSTAPANSVVTLTATIASNSSGVPPTGTVTFSAGGTSLGTAPVVGTPASATAFAGGTATLNFTFTSTGSKSITASYSGDANYAASGPSTAVTVTITTSGSFSISASPVTVTAGSSAATTITLTPTGGFTGAVQVTCAAAGLPPGVTCSPNPLTITIADANPATGQLTLAVAAPSTTLTAVLLPASRSPVDSIFSAQPATLAGLAPHVTPVAEFSPHRVVASSLGLSVVSAISALLLFFLPGRKRLRAAFALSMLSLLIFAIGCSSSNGGSGGSGGGPASTTTRLAVSVGKLPSTSDNFPFNITVTSSGSAPTGQVELFDGTSVLSTPSPLSNGTAAINSGLGTVGTHAVTAHYLGSATTSASQSGALHLTVTGTTTVTLASTPAASNAGATINLTIQ